MKSKFLIVFYLLALNIFSLSSFAKENFTVVTEVWDGYTNKDGSGAYFELLKKIFEPEYDFKYQLFPYARALYLVGSGREGFDAIIGVDEKSAKGLILPKYYIEKDKTYVVFDKKKTDYKDINSLKGKNVGFVNDYGYDKYLDFDIKIKSILPDNRDSVAQLLKLGRIDYYLDSTSVVDDLVTKKILNTDDFSMVIEPVLGTPLYVAFAKGSLDPKTKKYKGELLKEIFDKKFLEMTKNGDAQKFFEKYHLEVPTYNFN